MTAHSHRVITPGCYRCDLNLDEVAAAEREEAEQAAREAACPAHEWITPVIKFDAFDSWAKCKNCDAEEDR